MPAGRLTRPSQVREPRALRRLYEGWRIDHDIGRPTGFGGLVRQSVRQISESTGYTERHVRRGIARARRLREAVADALDTTSHDRR